VGISDLEGVIWAIFVPETTKSQDPKLLNNYRKITEKLSKICQNIIENKFENY